MDVFRLAPSPTGALHLGNARSFLLAWLVARQRKGTCLLRIDDLDGPRVKSGAEYGTLEDIRWLGLDWDGEPIRQSGRLARYRAALDRLAASGLTYPCICTRSETERAASAPNLGDRETPYPGTCRGRFATLEEARRAGGREPALRFVVKPGPVAFTDAFAGPCAFDPSAECGDFIVEKAEKSGPRAGTRVPAYQLATVVDDAELGVTEVLRGDDLLPSTARQILLQRALGFEPVRTVHVPLLVGSDGRRLAKRHGDTTVRRFREAGTPSEVLVGWLAFVSGLASEGARLHPADLVPRFSLERVPRERVVVRDADVERLLRSAG